MDYVIGERYCKANFRKIVMLSQDMTLLYPNQCYKVCQISISPILKALGSLCSCTGWFVSITPGLKLQGSQEDVYVMAFQNVHSF